MLGERLRAVRKKQGVTQEKLAEKASIAREMVGRYENGKASPDLPSLIKLADALDVSLDYLVGRSDSPEIVAPPVRAADPDPDPHQDHEEEADHVFTPEQEEWIKNIVNDMLQGYQKH